MNAPVPAVSSRPQIEPVPEGAPRPFWSVMIPTYNCAQLLRETLASVLAQAPDPSRMQIEVIDDCSTKDDPEAVVRELGAGRVAFYRHPQNVGAINNFNACLSRARGYWVHVLHGDDLVLPGFYAAVESAAERHPEVGLIATRSFYIDERGELLTLTERVRALERGGCDAAPYAVQNPFQCAGVVLRRRFVEQFGGFDPQLVHTADWEMWVRAIREGGCVTVNKALASYRVFGGNDTSRLKRTAENLRDLLRLRAVFEATQPGFDRAAFDRLVVRLARKQIDTFRKNGDGEALAANEDFWRSYATPKVKLMTYLESLARRMFKSFR